jgi:oligo-1,6-glucosidase
VNPNHTWLNAATQRTGPGSVFAWYRRLIRLRHEEPVLIDGRFILLYPEDPQLFAFTRTNEDTSLLVLANCSPEAVAVDVAIETTWAHAEVLLNNQPDANLTQQLRPWEVIVLRKRLS